MDIVPRSLRSWRIAVVVLASILAASAAFSREFWLAPGGVDAAGRGLSPDTPARTPQGLEQYTALTGGDHVWVRGGTYTGADFSIGKGGQPDRRIVYEAAPGETPVLADAALHVKAAWVEAVRLTVNNSSDRGVTADFSPQVILRALTVTGSASHGISVERSEGALVEGCVVRNAGNCGIFLNVLNDDPGNVSPGIVVRNCQVQDIMGTGIYSETDGVTIEDCEIARLGLGGGDLNSHGIYCKSRNSRLCRNRISQSSANGISLRNTGLVEGNVLFNNLKAGVIFFNDTDPAGGEVLIQNNLMTNNSGAGIWINGKDNAQNYSIHAVNNTVVGPNTAVRVEAYNGLLSVANNILWVTGSGEYDRVVNAQNIPAHFVERSNLHRYTGSYALPYYWGGRLTFDQYRQASGQAVGAILADPAFADAPGGNFHLKPESAAIDNGWPDEAPNDDADGNSRDAQPDLGAFEFQQAAPILASEYWLAPWGEDTAGRGLAADSPARTPQGLEGLYDLQAGNHVWLRGGLYQTDFSIHKGGAPGQPLVYEAAPGENPIVTSSTLYIEAPWVEVNRLAIENSPGWGVDADLSPGLVLRGLTVSKAKNHGIGVERSAQALIEECAVVECGGLGVRLNVLNDDPTNTSPGIVVRNCRIENNAGSGIYTETEGVAIENCDIIGSGLGATDEYNDHGIYCISRNARVAHNRVSGSTSNGISMRGAGLIESNFFRRNLKAGIMFFNDVDLAGGELTIQNNVAEDNGGAGIWINGKYQAQNYSVLTLNNTVYGQSAALRIEAYNGRLTVANNILSVTGSGEWDRVIYAPEVPANCVERNNLHSYTGNDPKPYLWGEWMTFEEYCQASGQAVQVVLADPDFQSVAQDDFHLRPQSAAIDHGWTDEFPAADADGASRESPPDIGAYQFVSHSAARVWQAYE